MNNIIEVNGLSKHYPDFSLSEASFTVPEGCITGFVGANGAGKTTTLRAILGLLEPRREIRLFGERSLFQSQSSEGRGSSDRGPWPIVSAWFGSRRLYEASPFQMKQIAGIFPMAGENTRSWPPLQAESIPENKPFPPVPK
ncbi:MAG: ATP-binding cassette domain-containing protein [Eisenbergiella massiliensis]